MCYVAQKEGRIENPRYLAIDPDVLLFEGVCAALGVANKSGVEILSLTDAISKMDLEGYILEQIGVTLVSMQD